MTSATDAIRWRQVLQLNDRQHVVSGQAEELRAAIQAGADLRIYSEFRHNEHIDTSSPSPELIRETMDMRTTYLIDGAWAAGISTLRQPVELPHGFGPRPSLSLFLYNENGHQAIARPYLDGVPAVEPTGISAPGEHSAMPRYHELDRWDDGSNGPCSNFIYDFDTIQYYVKNDWREVLETTDNGDVVSGSLREVEDLFARGVEWKLGIRQLCADLSSEEPGLPHEVFIQAGACYFYTEQQLLIASSHPLARVSPGVPLRYQTLNWDYSWLVARSDGQVARLTFDPYTLRYHRNTSRHAIRWFCR